MGEVDDLLSALVDNQPHALRGELEAWIRGSRRFKAFALRYQTKIRAKLRNARDEAGTEDVRAELAAAARLLRDERFALDYETYAAARQRGPDFTVTFRTHARFTVEVRRLRASDREGDEARDARLMSVLCDKARQMPPGMVNLLWLALEEPMAGEDVGHAATALRGLAERKAEDYFTRRRYDSAAQFLRQYRLLSGVVLAGEALSAWRNPLAKHAIPPQLLTAILRLDDL